MYRGNKHTRKTSGPYKQSDNLKSMPFSFSPYSLLSMGEGGWLKMPRKRKFRDLKTADNEKALLEISFQNYIVLTFSPVLPGTEIKAA